MTFMRGIVKTKWRMIDKVLSKVARTWTPLERIDQCPRADGSFSFSRNFNSIVSISQEEREMRRQSLAQLKLSYYPKNGGHFSYFGTAFPPPLLQPISTTLPAWCANGCFGFSLGFSFCSLSPSPCAFALKLELKIKSNKWPFVDI